MSSSARFRFHGTLNDFMNPVSRDTWINYSFRNTPAVKDAIEALGVPHTEVNVIIVNTHLVDFKYKLQSNDEVEVHPKSPYTQWPESIQLVPESLPPYRFVLDVHLGKLARLLRLLGFDSTFDPDLTDKEIAGISINEQRILLTRDVGLLKLKTLTQGYWLRSQQPDEQVQEVVRYYKLMPEFRLFSRCMVCDGVIEAVEKEKVWDVLPPKTKLYFHEFYQCTSCHRVYWKGSHYERMQQFVRSLT